MTRVKFWMGVGIVVLAGVSVAGNIGQYVAYSALSKKLMIGELATLTVHDEAAFEQLAYDEPTAWLWRPEPKGIARLRPDYLKIELPDMLEEGARDGSIFDKAVRTYAYYRAHRQEVAERYLPEDDGTVFCDEDTALLRGMLMLQGVQSRVVNFQFEDGDGGASHTALEVWLPLKRTWAYFDPHYGAYAPATALEVAEDFSRLQIDAVENRAALQEVFGRGMQEFVVEGHVPRQRLRYVPRA